MSNGPYIFTCMCGYVGGGYKNPYAAGLAAKTHAEEWCPLRDPANGLGCYFCWQKQIYKGFPTFDLLAYHVQTEHFGRKVNQGEKMNIGTYVQEGSGDGRLPLLDAKLHKKLAKGGIVVGKMLACREIKSENFKGLAMDFKHGKGTKFSFLARFDRWDITALAKQTKADDTDDWIGEDIRFVLRKAKKGPGFVNVELPKLPKGKKRRK